MIIFIKEKDFIKKCKSLVAPKDYVIADATDDSSGKIATKFANTTSLDSLKPPKSLVNGILSDNDNIDPDKIESLGKKFLKSHSYLNTAVGLVLSQAKTDKNFFVVFKSKDFKAYGKNILKNFKKNFPTSADVFFIYNDDMDKKFLGKVISEKTQEELNDACKKLIKHLEEMDEEKKKDKKKKKKKKDKKKKDKKKKKKDKKSKYVFLDLD